MVGQEQFDLVAQKLSKNKSFARRNNKANEHLLRALVSCGECMLASIAVAKTFGKNNDRKQRYYVCSGKFNKAQSAPEEKCSSRYAPAEQLDEIVWKDLCEVLTHPESITDALRRAHGGEWLPQELKARQENLRKGRSALGRQLERLTEAYLGEVIPLAEYQRRRKNLEQRDESLAAQERQLRSQTRQRMELVGVAGSIEDFCERVRGGLAEATFEQKRKLVELLIDRVIVTGEEVEIRYVIPTDPSSEQVRFCHLRSDYLHHPPPRQHHEAFGGQQFLPIYRHALFGPLPAPTLIITSSGAGFFGRSTRSTLQPRVFSYPVRALVLPAVARVQPQMREAGKPLVRLAAAAS